MIASDHDRRRELAARDEVVQRDSELRALALAKPTNAGGQALEVDALSRHVDPPMQMLVVRKELQHQLIRPCEILWIARQCDPSKRALPFAKQRTHVFRN